MNEWNNEWPFIPIHADLCEHILKRNAYSEFYSGNSLNVCICLTTAYIIDGPHWWQIDITPIKRNDPKIVPPYRCETPRLTNKTPIHPTVATGSEHVVCPQFSYFWAVRNSLQNLKGLVITTVSRAKVETNWDNIACSYYTGNPLATGNTPVWNWRF